MKTNKLIMTLLLAVAFGASGLFASKRSSNSDAKSWQDHFSEADAKDLERQAIELPVPPAGKPEDAAYVKAKEAYDAAVAAIDSARSTAIEAALKAAGEEGLDALRKRFARDVATRHGKAFAALMDADLPIDRTSALRLSASIVDFSNTWKPLYTKDGKLDRSINDVRASTLHPFLAIPEISRFADRPAPFEPFADEAAEEAFIAMLKRVAAFIPDMRTAAYFDKKGQVVPKSELMRATEKNDPLLIRKCVNAVVDDLNNTYGKMDAPMMVRKAIVAEYSKATTLGSTGPFATIMAIVGSLVLFGGLAYALFIAASSKKRVSQESEA